MRGNYNPRLRERRDCLNFDDICLDRAARLDLRAIPCQACIRRGGIQWPKIRNLKSVIVRYTTNSKKNGGDNGGRHG